MPPLPKYPSSPALAHGTAHRFVVTAGSRDLGSWSKVAGLEVKWDVAEHRVGDSDQYFKYAGIAKFEKLKLTRAADPIGTKLVQTWLDEVASTGGVPEEGAVEIISAAAGSVVSWTIREMFPHRWKISDFDMGSGKIFMETLEIVHSGFLTAANRATPT